MFRYEDGWTILSLDELTTLEEILLNCSFTI